MTWWSTSCRKLREAKKQTERLDPISKCARLLEKSYSRRPILRECSVSEACAKLLGKTLKNKSKEADTSSAFPQMLNESEVKFKVSKIREAGLDKKDGSTIFEVILIQEGMGNFNDAYYYAAEALESALPLFDGAKIYADHPSLVEEETRPERSVRDVLGYYAETKILQENDRANIAAKVKILAGESYDWARNLMREAVKYKEKFPDRELIGLSINAAGASEELSIDEVIGFAPDGAKPKLIEAKEQGIESVRVVREITRAISCDLVTEAGAGGKILKLIQGE